MTLAKHTTWKETEASFSEPQFLSEILRDNRFSNGRLDVYLQALTEKSGVRFPNLIRIARYGFVFQKGEGHLEARRTIAPFFSARAVSGWGAVAEQAIGHAIERLASSKTPDLIQDFCEPAYIQFIRQFVGCPGGDDAELLKLIRTVNAVATPMLPLKSLRSIESACGKLIGHFPVDPKERPDSFFAFLSDCSPPQKEIWEPLDIAISTLVASHTLTQSLGFILYSMLLGDLKSWQETALPGWAEDSLDKLIAHFPSTLSLVRVAEASVTVAGCPFREGDAARLDVVRANNKLALGDQSKPKYLAFGHGAHKCPGEQLSRMFIGLAIPALAKAFPRLALQRDKVPFHISKLVQYPLSLPCTLSDNSVRENARLVEIRNHEEARSIVTDSSIWAPPQMEPYLKAIADRSGRDMSTSLRIACNAMFFMSGPRHAEIRLAASHFLGGNRIRHWRPFIEAEADTALQRLAQAKYPDLIGDFTEPLFRSVAQPILGVRAHNQQRFDELAPDLQDVLEPWLPLRELNQLQKVFSELLELIDIKQASSLIPESLLNRLISTDLPSFDEADLKSFILVLYGASFNLSHTLGNILHFGLSLPASERVSMADQDWVIQHMEELISLCASPKYIYRMARKQASVGELVVGESETVRLQLLQINRGLGAGHLAFGHGLHRCIGAALTKEVLRVAVPGFFSRFPAASLPAQNRRYHDISQTVALAELPCRLSRDQAKEKNDQP